MLLVSRSRFVEENAVVFPFPSDIFMPLAKLWFICLQEQFPILRTRNSPDLYLLIHPLTLILEFVQSPFMLAIYSIIAHTLSLRDVDRDFPFTED
jgi:hypothetical protein